MEAAPWSKRRPAAAGAAARGARWHVLVAGRDRPRWRRATRRPWRSGSRSATSARSPTRYYNASFQFAVPRGVGDPDVPDGRRRTIGLAYLEEALRHLPPDRRPARRGERAVGRSATTTTSTSRPATASRQFRQALEMFREVGDRTMEAWSPAHARDEPAPRRASSTRRGRRSSRRSRHFWRPGDAAGITLTLDDLSADRGRRGRPAARRPAARRGAEPDGETGAGLAAYVEDIVRLAGAGPACARRCPRRTSRATARRARR